MYDTHNHDIDVDFIRLEKVYDILYKISEEEAGVYEKILKDSINNICEQIKNYNKSVYKYMTRAATRIMVIWSAQEKWYDP